MTIYVEGKLRTRSWDDKEGHKHYTTEVVGDNFTILSKKENTSSSGKDESENLNAKTGDDLPF